MLPAATGGVSATGGKGATGGGGGTGGSTGAATSNWTKEATADWIMLLHVGASWTFKETPIDPQSPMVVCNIPDLPTTAKVVGTAEVPDDTGAIVEAVLYQPLCSTDQYAVYGSKDSLSGNLVDLSTQTLSADSVILCAPPAEGLVFGEQSQYKWTRAADQTVPAGTFTDCWERRPAPVYDTSGTITITYCRGVGIVSYEFTADNVRGELVSRT